MDVQIKKARLYLGNIIQIICLNVTIDVAIYNLLNIIFN